MADRVSIIAFQSITPAKVSPPGKSRRISVAGDLPPASLAAHFRLILYYPAAAGERSRAQAVGAWMKESLGEALNEAPVLAGRLRRSKAAGGGEWEVRANDAGVRLVLARVSAEMAEFLNAEDREEREWGLVYWRDVEMENPDQSALFYIQATDFEDSGFSIGISCSLLLSDPLFLIRFLLKWAHTHRHVSTVPPVFYLTNFKPSPLPPHLAAISAAAGPTSTLLLRRPLAAGDFADSFPPNSGNLTFLRSECAGDVKVESWVSGGEERGGGGEPVEWEELGAGDLMIGEKHSPVSVSYRIVPGGAGAGLVVAMVPDDGEEMLVSVTVPVSVPNGRE